MWPKLWGQARLHYIQSQIEVLSPIHILGIDKSWHVRSYTSNTIMFSFTRTWRKRGKHRANRFGFSLLWAIYIKAKSYWFLLHKGQELFLERHFPMQGWWNMWWHSGRIPATSPCWKSYVPDNETRKLSRNPETERRTIKLRERRTIRLKDLYLKANRAWDSFAWFVVYIQIRDSSFWEPINWSPDWFIGSCDVDQSLDLIDCLNGAHLIIHILYLKNEVFL